MDMQAVLKALCEDLKGQCINASLHGGHDAGPGVHRFSTSTASEVLGRHECHQGLATVANTRGLPARLRCTCAP
ncbi:MAG: hypothetical protein RLZZ618_991 [Pseudomonadota bacterium]|jgi:hypothetical protein